MHKMRFAALVAMSLLLHGVPVVGAAAVLFLAGMVATLVPVHRATRADPARTIMRG